MVTIKWHLQEANAAGWITRLAAARAGGFSSHGSTHPAASLQLQV